MTNIDAQRIIGNLLPYILTQAVVDKAEKLADMLVEAFENEDWEAAYDILEDFAAAPDEIPTNEKMIFDVVLTLVSRLIEGSFPICTAE